MKKSFKTIFLLSALLMSAAGMQTVIAQNTFPASGSVGIGTTTPDGSALLEVKSTAKGVLFPRMTKTQRDAIVSPSAGLLIYQTNSTKGFYYYTGSGWTAINIVGGLNSNLFIGANAGKANVSNSTTGIGNIGLGRGAYATAVDRIYNTAVGDSSLYDLGSGAIGNQSYYNTAVGAKSQRYSTTGTKNTSVGAYSLYNTIAGNDDVAIGYNAMFSNLYNHFCVAIGEDALYASKGDDNTAIGFSAGSTPTFSSECTYLGADADQTGTTSFANATALGSASRTTGNSQVRLGNSSVTSIGGFANFTNVSDGRYKKEIKENVPGLAFINKLKPVTYHLDVRGLRTFLHEERAGQTPETKSRIEKGIVDKEAILYSGFVAQDVERAAQETGYDFSGVDKPQNNESLYGLRYAEFTVPLVKAVQELDKLNGELKMKNENLELRVAALESMLNTQNSSLKSAAINEVHPNNNSQLFQNQPNPFNKTSVINYMLKSGDVQAKIIIRDLNGNLVKEFNLSQNGKGQVTINANELAQGTYTYTLEVNNESVDTRLMVLVK